MKVLLIFSLTSKNCDYWNKKILIDFVTKQNMGFMMTFTGEGCCSRESLKSKLFTFFCNIIYDGAYLSPANLPMCTYVLSTYLCVSNTWECYWPRFLVGYFSPIPTTFFAPLSDGPLQVNFNLNLSGGLAAAASEFQFLLPSCCIIQSEPLVKFHLI